MPDKHIDDIWKDKLGGYQAPADPQDWADMAALLDAKEEKRAGFFWWWLVAASLFIVVGGGLYQLMMLQNQQLDAFAISGPGNNTNPSNESNGNTTINTDKNTSNEHSEIGDYNTLPTANNEAVSNDGLATTTNPTPNSGTIESNGNNIGSASNKPLKSSSKKGKGANKHGSKNNASSTTKGNSKVASTNNLKGSSNSNNGSIVTNNNGNSSASNTANATSNSYEKPVGTISVKRLKALPNPLALTVSKDTIKRDWRDKLLKPKAVQHYLGLSHGWSSSWVDRSGDARPGYNVGLQYSMMVKNRAGIHAGMAYRQYNYYTDLVACNYELYQCPNNYSSTLQTIDLNIGAQVNLVKTDKIEWYVMGGVNNQFMLKETFAYNLPKIDTVSPNPLPPTPPNNTSFTGAGVSDYNESIDASLDASILPSGVNGEPATGRFLRERYLGAWYVGTGITWHFAGRMNLQVEPVIGRTMQFVGIQDKKLWTSGVNVRVNVRLGR